MKRVKFPTPAAWKKSLIILLWVATSFIVAQLMVGAVFYAFRLFGIHFTTDNPSLITLVAVSVYVLTLFLVVFVPHKLFGRARVSKSQLGVTRLPTWLDIVLTPPAAFIYLLTTAVFVTLVTWVFPGFNAEQTQDIGFDNLARQSDYILAFITLIVLAPVAEELLFRGYLYGKLRPIVGLLPAIVLTSLLFGAAHMQWNLAIDTFALSLVLCSLREITGSIWAGVLLHMLKNGVAFYFIFINPSLLGTIGG